MNQAAHQTVQAVIDRTEPPKPTKNLAAVALGTLGGQKGGPARAAKLTPEQRREIALKGARARHRTVRMSLAMKAGVTDRLWSIRDIVGLMEEHEARQAA